MPVPSCGLSNMEEGTAMADEQSPSRIEKLEFDLRVLEAVVAALLAELPRELVERLHPNFDLARRPPGPEINAAETEKYDLMHRVLNHAHEFVGVVLNASRSNDREQFQ